MLSCEFCEFLKNIYFKEHIGTVGSKTPVRGFLFNKVASLMAWRPLTVLERGTSTGIFLWVLCNCLESFFVEHLLATTSRMMFFFSFLQIGKFFSLKSFISWNNGKLGEGIHKPVLSCVVVEIGWKLHCEVAATHVPT